MRKHDTIGTAIVAAVPAATFEGIDVNSAPFLRYFGRNDSTVLVRLGSKATRQILAVPARQRDATLADASRHQIAEGHPRGKADNLLWVESLKAVLA